MSSSSSYPLKNSRFSRPTPSALNFEASSLGSSSILSHPPLSDSHNLLYDVPGTSPPSTPTSPTLNGRLASPTSPTQHSRSRSPRPRNGRSTPIPSGRNRSATPSGEPAASDLERFTGYCRAWYFSQDEESSRLMTQMLASTPPSQRAPYSRVQASIRSAYHVHVKSRKTAEFRAHLSATSPGGSLMPHSRANPDGPLAMKERHESLERFIKSWCTMGMPGTQPFFEGLWALMRLQVLPENLGGAGGNRIEWEVDDAVFKEAAGKDFMLEAIDVLKGVLGFEEVLASKRSSSTSLANGPYPESNLHSRSQSQPLSKVSNFAAARSVRARAPSDPFLDAPALGRPSSSSGTREEPFSKSSPQLEQRFELSGNTLGELEESDEDFMRVWTSPDLPNSEFNHFLDIFPTFITRRTLPRFPTSQLQRDIEEGFEDAKQIRCGTGSMWVSNKVRRDDWHGGWWLRFFGWLRRLWC